jgi:hypothetical protein
LIQRTPADIHADDPLQSYSAKMAEGKITSELRAYAIYPENYYLIVS